ncbi:MAG TPA: hypothetical protein VM364_10470, partial [Vicinamibacterales bacterium]|nr:hypothetical protein [Vicinamibacterales bacterium]
PELPSLPPAPEWPSAPAAPGLPPLPPMPPLPAAPPAPPAPPAPAGDTQSRSATVSGTRDQSSGNFVWTSNGEKIEVKYRGSFELNDDDTDIVKLSPGGSVRFSDGAWLRAHSVEFTADRSGTISRRYFVGSSERAFEPEGREWLAKMLPRFVRVSGFGAEARVARILRQGGVPAVLAETTRLEGSHTRRVYLTELVKAATFDGQSARQVLEQAGRGISSDYELATLLIDSGDRLLVDDASRKAYLDAVTTIESDYEMRRVLGSLVRRGGLSPRLLAGVLQTATHLQSDYEAASLLLEIVRQHPIDEPVRAPFFAVMGTIGSAYEKGRVLQALLRRTDVSQATLLDILSEAARIPGSHEAGQVLRAAARSHAITGPARDAYIRAAERLGDHEQTQALAALVRNEKR